MANKSMTIEQWIKYGFDKGWCGPPVCETHDSIPTSIFEDEVLWAGDDPCIHIIRLYEDLDTKEAVEANHSPSNWRASNRGLKQ